MCIWRAIFSRACRVRVAAPFGPSSGFFPAFVVYFDTNQRYLGDTGTHHDPRILLRVIVGQGQGPFSKKVKGEKNGGKRVAYAACLCARDHDVHAWEFQNARDTPGLYNVYNERAARGTAKLLSQARDV